MTRLRIALTLLIMTGFLLGAPGSFGVMVGLMFRLFGEK